jgi:predicted ribosome quality control (RQC) complex YloA/Tae2 family protein
VDPFGLDHTSIDSVLAASMADGESLHEAIRRRLFGIGAVAATQISDEAASTGRSPGTLLCERLSALEAGGLDPVITGSDDPMGLADDGPVATERLRLRPWSPDPDEPGIRRRDAAATAGLYHEAVERAAEIGRRVVALRSVLDREVDRLWETETKIGADLRTFEDPEHHRLWAEAVLAGMSSAQRGAEHVRVPDPYDSSGAWLVVPARGGMPLAEVAERHFRAHRRARRGEQAARRRRSEVCARRQRLERLRAENEGDGLEHAGRLEAGMRAERIPVGLARRAKRGGPDPAVRVEGVRMFTGADGEPILVGRSGKGNDRLTFKIAGPEDFWLHVQGRPGAHVVVRNRERRARPPEEILEQAAAFAAWFSVAREETHVEVQWTRRKNVRRARGAPPGTVTLKRFETIRVRPREPRRE